MAAKRTSELANAPSTELATSDALPRELQILLDQSDVVQAEVKYTVQHVTREMKEAMVQQADRQHAEPVRARGRYALAIVAVVTAAALGLVLGALAMTDWDKDVIKWCVPIFVVAALGLGGVGIWKFGGLKEK